MNEVTLPASPNWYRSRVIACSENGLIAWGARNNIVIARSSNDSKILQYSMIRSAHTERVNCLAFPPTCGQSNKNLLISSGNEHIARVWDLDNLSAIKAYSYTDTTQIIAAVDWSNSPDIACIISIDGVLVSWNLSLDIHTSILLGKTTVTCLSCCPHDADLVAVGMKNGLVYIINVTAQTKGAVMYKLRGHDAEIVSLSWCPEETNVISGTGKRDLLLASGGKDKSLFIWRAGGDGRYETEITLPKTPIDSQQHRSKLNAVVGNWTVVCWIRPTLLLASSPWGELVSYELSSLNAAKNKPVWKLVHGSHSRGLFCISHVPKAVKHSIDNWREDSIDTIWTTGQDRKVVCCKVTGEKVEIEYAMPTQGGFVYCIAACPVETSRVALGIGDATLYLWNLSEPHKTSFDITVLWQRIQGQVRTISWHPEKEHILAYATEDGRVGIVDTNERKLPIILRPYHRNIVYNLGWGIDPQTKKDILFSCAEEELVYYHVDQPNQVPTTLFAKKCTSFAWKPDFSCLAVGFNTGSITFLDKNFVERHRTIYPLKKGIFCLSWHPESTATDVCFSPLRHYLAVAADASTVLIFDLSDIAEDFSEPQKNVGSDEIEDSQSTPKVVAMLNGHTERVVCLAWSPHFSGHLISASYDGTAQVWNVETKQLMGTFTGHIGPILTCIWSPLDPDLIITGGTDFTIHVWRLSRQNPVIPTGKSSSKKFRSKKNKQKASKKNVVELDSVTNKSDITAVEGNGISNGTSNVENLTIDVTTEKEVTDKDSSEKLQPPNKSSSESKKSIILNSIRKLVKHAQNKEVDLKNIENEDITPSLFSNEKDFSALLTDRKLNYSSQSMHDMATEIDVWTNSLKENLEQAVKEKRLNDFLVSLAPSLSMKTWMETCDAYAIQLISEGNCRKAVTYLLCIHKIPQAVQVLENANMYKEAYTLARCKLDPEDKLIQTVLKHWAEYASQRDYEEAARCYAKLGDFSMAAKMLMRRDDTQCLEIAAELASLAGESELCVSLAERAIVKIMSGADYANAYRLIEKFPEISYRKVHISVCQEIKKTVQKVEKINSIFEWLQGEAKYGLLQALCITHEDRNTYADLCQRKITFNPENEPKLWINVSYDIAIALLCDKEEKRLQHVVTALDSISQFEIQHLKHTNQERRLLMDILSHLDMKSPTDSESIYAKKDYPVSRSLRAYLCVGLLHWVVRGLKNSTIEKEIETVIKMIQTLLEDVLNKETVKFWSMTNDITKLEAKITSALVDKSRNKDDTGDEKEDITDLIIKLDKIKNAKKQFIEERISAPCPIIAYSLANELIDRLPDQAIKAEFAAVLTEKWTKAVLE